jgi:hypothetical protein
MMLWTRFFAVVAAALIGVVSGVGILAFDNAPRWLVALSGIFLGIGGVATIALLVFIVTAIIDELRPAVRLRKPVNPLFFARKEASMVGRSRYRLHPIRFWGSLTFNNTFLLGFMFFEKPQTIDFKDDTE